MATRYAPVKVNGAWEPRGVVPRRGYDRVLRVPPLDVLPPRFLIRAPLIKRYLTVRPIATIDAEIRRATVPALRPEDC